MLDSEHSPEDTVASGTCDTHQLNTLLGGELAAVETYEQALEKFEGDWAATTLQHIRDEHSQAADWLRDRVRSFGGLPSESSGPWGTFASVVTGAAKEMGPATAIAALEQGEQYGINEYEETLRNEDVNPECKAHIHSKLLPQLKHHLVELDHLMGPQNQA